MADNQITVDVIARLDTIEKQLSSFQKNTEKQFSEVGDNVASSIGSGVTNSLTSLASKVGAVAAAVVIVKQQFEAFAESILEGDKIKQLEQQFGFLSQSVGVAGEALKESLIKASGGLVDDTKILESANRGLVALGQNAERLPEVFELARKATVVFGGTATENFDFLNQVIASGNTRSLKSLGIIIDSEQAYKKYADSIGVSVAALTEAGKRQAIFNEVIEKGNKSFAAIDPNVQNTTTSFQKLKVAINDLNDTLAVRTSNTFGDFASKTLDGLRQGVVRVTDKIKEFAGVEKLPITQQSEILERNLKAAREDLEAIQKINAGLAAPNLILEKQAQQRIDDLSLQRELLAEQQRKTQSLAQHQAQLTAAAEVPAKKAEDLFISEKLIADREKAQAKIAEINVAIVEAQKASLSEIERARLFSEAKQTAVQEEFESQRADLLLQRRTADIQTKAFIDEQIIAAEELKNQKLLQLQQQADKVGQILGSNFQKSLGQGIAGGIQNVVTSLAKGQNAFANFGKFILGVIGDFAIQAGTAIIAAGLGYKSLGDFTGTAPLIFGAALVALGSLLKAFSGTPDTGVGGGAGGGATSGGLAGGGFGGSPATSLSEGAVAARGTVVNVNVAGNVLDRRQSGLEIASVIQEHFDNNGSVLAQGGVV